MASLMTRTLKSGMQVDSRAGTTWGTADFNGDGFTDVSDFNLWNAYRGESGNLAVVPEPFRDHHVAIRDRNAGLFAPYE